MKRVDGKAAAKIDKLFADACILHEQGRINDAQQRYRKILELDPAHINSLNRLAAIYLERNAPKEAAALLTKSLGLFPGQPLALCNIGLCLEKSGDVNGALAAYERALVLQPDFPGVLYNRGTLLRKQKRFPEALADYEKALALQPGFADAYNNRGNVLTDMGRLEAAIDSFGHAIRLRPHYAEAFNNRGVCFWRLKCYQEAIADYEQALAIKENYFSALLNLATALFDIGQYERASVAITSARVLQPNEGEAIALQYEIAARCCDWQNYEAQVTALAGAVKDEKILRPFTVVTAIDDPQLQMQAAKTWSTRFAAVSVDHEREENSLSPAAPSNLLPPRIRVAYLSADFHEHATAWLIAGVFECHDKQLFECHAISLGRDQPGPMRSRLQKACEYFVDASGWTDEQIVEYIQQNAIDVLVDLKGYTGDSRPAVLASRPAVIQAGYLGYPGTMGAPWLDYFLADKQALPESLFPFFAEKIVWLPGSYQCNDGSRDIAEPMPTRAAVGLPESGFVFCCFNHHYKITPVMFDVWMRLLHLVPDSVLWLLVTNDNAIANLRATAQRSGIDPTRLVFASHLPLSQHLSRLRLADLFLDTLPCNAHTTASDALWSGLPLVTCVGQSFPARVASSLLHALGLPELVAETVEDYQALALRLASEPESLSAIREKIRVKKSLSTLFDARESARKLEQAYRVMWERHQHGVLPDHLTIS